MPSHESTYGNFFKFNKDDVFLNRIKTYPKVEFFIYDGTIYYNNENQKESNYHTPHGHINLYELNVNRNLLSSEPDLIYPFITKAGSLFSFKTTSTDSLNLDFAFGDVMKMSYPLTASISIDQYGTTLTAAKRDVLYALQTTFNHYTTLHPHYAYSSSFGDKEKQELNIISIPSIFYGSGIKKGSIIMKYYVSGTLAAEVSDKYRDGRLIQTSGTTTGNTIGLALYNEGFLVITSSAAISGHQEAYAPNDSTPRNASWHYFAATGSESSMSSSYLLEFKGVNYIDTLTMHAHAKEKQLNFSNNPTFLTGSAKRTVFSSSIAYYEDAKSEIKNIVSSSYKGHNATYKPVTYISKVGIYDKDKNLIAIAGLANPVRKLEDRGYTFKLKIDI